MTSRRLAVAVRRGGVVLAAVLTLAFLPVGSPVARATDPTADIPGVPLPGTVVSSQLGGSIYDVVYSIDVPAGDVVIAGLTGSGGTDFDLYLFNSSATTVVNNVGVVASSTGPTSTESLSYPVRATGRYYIDLNGATNVQGTFILTVQVVPDPTPPIAGIVLNGGRPAAASATVSVDLQAYDDLSGVPDMAFSEDGAIWTDWRLLAFHTSWTFAGADGARRLWVKVRNGVGLESAPASATVTLDTVPPTILAVDPVAGSRVGGLRPTFRVSFNEQIDPASWTPYGLVVQSSATGTLVNGVYGLDATHRIGTFVPSSDLAAGVGYVVTVGPVTDLAGNAVTGTSSWAVTPLLPASVTVRAMPTVVALGGAAVLSGRFIGPDTNPTLSFLERPAGAASFAPVDGAGSAYGSSVTFTVRPVSNTTYRLAYPGSSTIADASAEIRVLVRRGIRLTVLGTTSGGSRVGRRVTLQATIDPAAAGVSVSFQLYRYDPIRRTYRYAGSWGRGTSTGGRASYVWTPVSTGVYRWRAMAFSTAAFANNTTTPLGWTVGR